MSLAVARRVGANDDRRLAVDDTAQAHLSVSQWGPLCRYRRGRTAATRSDGDRTDPPGKPVAPSPEAGPHAQLRARRLLCSDPQWFVDFLFGGVAPAISARRHRGDGGYVHVLSS